MHGYQRFEYHVFLTFSSWPLGRADPECVLGHLLKILFKNDDFMNTVRIDELNGHYFHAQINVFVWHLCQNGIYVFFSPLHLQLVNSYVMTSREFSLNAAACRLLQNIMPGLETAVVFQEKVSYL